MLLAMVSESEYKRYKRKMMDVFIQSNELLYVLNSDVKDLPHNHGNIPFNPHWMHIQQRPMSLTPRNTMGCATPDDLDIPLECYNRKKK